MKQSRLIVGLLGLNLAPLILLMAIQYFTLPAFGLKIYGPYFVVATLLLAIYCYSAAYTWKELGLSGNTILRPLVLNLIFSLGIMALILSFFYYNPFSSFRTLHAPTWDNYYLPYVLLYCPAQEFIYRSFLFAFMKREHITNPWLLIAISTFSYSFVHILFLNGFTIFLTAVIGLAWGYLYHKQQNFWGLALSHALLGVTTIAIGFL